MDEKTIKIVIADDIAQIRKHFKSIFDYEKDICVIDSVCSGREAVEAVTKHNPDILLTDIQMETNCDGIDAIRHIKQKNIETKCVVLTIHNEDELIYGAFEAGAIDYIIKDSSAVDIINAVKMAYENATSLRPEIAEKLRNEFGRMKRERDSLLYTFNLLYSLTQSELEILKLLYNGHKQKDLPKLRFVEPATIRTHISNIIRKFEKRSIKEVINMLRELRIMETLN